MAHNLMYEYTLSIIKDKKDKTNTNTDTKWVVLWYNTTANYDKVSVRIFECDSITEFLKEYEDIIDIDVWSGTLTNESNVGDIIYGVDGDYITILGKIDENSHLSI